MPPPPPPQAVDAVAAALVDGGIEIAAADVVAVTLLQVEVMP